MSTTSSNAVMTIVQFNRLRAPDPIPLANNAAKRTPSKTVDKPVDKPVEPKAAINKSAKSVDANDSSQTSAKKGRTLELASESSSNAVAVKDWATLGNIANRYKLQVPKSVVEDTPTPAQQAAQDVRSNSAKLSKSEKFAVAMGTLDCVFQARLPDGKIIREPGRWIIVPARSDGTLKPLAKARFCIRLHQAENENTNDLTAISTSIKGKL
ncbi:hypothetical protein [Undibacterium flavidum]|uniref:Uncharacterized protein n=1 Tax=Undibacterium flavidum TaxID=2762297 RepID=A0ABR6YEV2_9BURK|nr:hypothetical protein [Undibacterium flavidum]MBC3875100.1 hypothetical protein [Undibacterium flavidum]